MTDQYYRTVIMNADWFMHQSGNYGWCLTNRRTEVIRALPLDVAETLLEIKSDQDALEALPFVWSWLTHLHVPIWEWNRAKE